MPEPDVKPDPPTTDDMHWAVTYLQNDLKEVKQDLRDLRRESHDFRKETAQDFSHVRQEMGQLGAGLRQEMGQLRTEVRQDLRHLLMAMIAMSGVIVGVLMAFIEYRLPGG